ncbi:MULTISPECIES: TIGR03750 family conjugal transfer protein [Photorhabdus]|uniref:TIGR03750 family conjugal transfer protein n=1 Tax=Photorhabdus luminescens subsp. sonorensis TaxID=1173677 RepID=A0A5C4REP5_PHOLU|nr:MULTISPECIES: TIGR03750 family conjugal transfer protein [Photorhabdus]MCA6220309.1 TIGR03750 family conjugal transfer protein [Photorhabdus antumapuensis]TNH42241.1 TIGR03750 family conjugal transfer protein [Photorhabdus luminescens subsp. sonorensis]
MVQTIRFLPDRLNAEPIVFRGFTTPELGWTALTGLIAGTVIGLLLAPVTGWVMIPTVALIAPLLLIAFGGKYLARMKRGKPENYLYRQLEVKKRHYGLGDPSLIVTSQCWALRRSYRVITKARRL